MFCLSKKKTAPDKAKISIDNCPVEMEIDTGAVWSVVLKPCSRRLGEQAHEVFIISVMGVPHSGSDGISDDLVHRCEVDSNVAYDD